MGRPPDPASLERPWIDAYPPGVPPTYRLPEVALPRLLDDAARDFPAHPAVVADGTTTDHATLRDRVADTTGVLAGLGIEHGQRVLVALPNGQAAPVVLFALWRLGAVVVPIAPDLAPERLVAVAEDAEVSAVVAVRRVVHALAQRQGAPPTAVVVTGDEWPPRRRLRFPRPPLPGRLDRSGLRDGAVTLAASLAGGIAAAGMPAPSPTDPALLAYRPGGEELRGVVLTHANLVASAFQTRLWIPDIQAGRERVLVADPLHEPVALVLGLLSGMLSAATLVLLDRPDAGALARAVERQRPTLLATVPDRLAGLASDGEPRRRDLTSLRVCLTVGAPLDRQVAAEVERRTGGARVREGFGVAEAGPLTLAQPVYGRADIGSIGLPVTDTVAAIVDPDDLSRVLAPDRPGLLLVHGPQVAAGYWRRDEASARTFVDGWVVTSDLASVDVHGVFHHVGRIDEVVRRGGELVSLREVETVLEQHPDVQRAGAVDDGDLLVAAVVLRRRARADADQLVAHCRDALGSTAVPDHVTLVDRLPEDETGGLARDELRRELAGR